MSRAATGLEMAEGPRLLLPMQPLARVAVVLTLLTSGIVFSELPMTICGMIRRVLLRGQEHGRAPAGPRNGQEFLEELLK